MLTVLNLCWICLCWRPWICFEFGTNSPVLTALNLYRVMHEFASVDGLEFVSSLARIRQCWRPWICIEICTNSPVLTALNLYRVMHEFAGVDGLEFVCILEGCKTSLPCVELCLIFLLITCAASRQSAPSAPTTCPPQLWHRPSQDNDGGLDRR